MVEISNYFNLPEDYNLKERSDNIIRIVEDNRTKSLDIEMNYKERIAYYHLYIIVQSTIKMPNCRKPGELGDYIVAYCLYDPLNEIIIQMVGDMYNGICSSTADWLIFERALYDMKKLQSKNYMLYANRHIGAYMNKRKIKLDKMIIKENYPIICIIKEQLESYRIHFKYCQIKFKGNCIPKIVWKEWDRIKKSYIDII